MAGGGGGGGGGDDSDPPPEGGRPTAALEAKSKAFGIGGGGGGLPPPNTGAKVAAAEAEAAAAESFPADMRRVNSPKNAGVAAPAGPPPPPSPLDAAALGVDEGGDPPSRFDNSPRNDNSLLGCVSLLPVFEFDVHI